MRKTGIDRVQRRNGIDSGTITATTPLGVTISKGGVTTQIPAEEIRSISFADEPPQFNAIRSAIGRGRFDSAQQSLEKLDPDDFVRSEVRQDFEFLSAACQGNLALAGKGEIQDALTSVGTFLSTNRTSFHIPEAIQLQGDLYLAAGDVVAARKKYETLAKAPSPHYKALSGLLVGQLLQQQGDHPTAIEQFDSAVELARKSVSSADIATQARLQRSVSLSAVGKLDEAVAAIKREIVAIPSDDTSALAAGYNALGTCYLAAGELRGARDAYLHVDLLFESASEEHAKALFNLGKVWTEMNQPTRAKETRARLAKEYPLSRWSGR